MTGAPQYKTVNEYIADLPKDVQAVVKKVRQTLRAAAPGAKETISYNIPTLTLDGKYLIYFAGFKNHVSVYPAQIEGTGLEKQLSAYVAGKGTLKFPLDEPIPYALIARYVKFRVRERKNRAAARGKEK
jgi:uncharacterized protein YdhG (YjbR/CyaY superfamily)